MENKDTIGFSTSWKEEDCKLEKKKILWITYTPDEAEKAYVDCVNGRLTASEAMDKLQNNYIYTQITNKILQAINYTWQDTLIKKKMYVDAMYLSGLINETFNEMVSISKDRRHKSGDADFGVYTAFMQWYLKKLDVDSKNGDQSAVKILIYLSSLKDKNNPIYQAMLKSFNQREMSIMSALFEKTYWESGGFDKALDNLKNENFKKFVKDAIDLFNDSEAFETLDKDEFNKVMKGVYGIIQNYIFSIQRDLFDKRWMAKNVQEYFGKLHEAFDTLKNVVEKWNKGDIVVRHAKELLKFLNDSFIWKYNQFNLNEKTNAEWKRIYLKWIWWEKEMKRLDGEVFDGNGGVPWNTIG